MFLDDVSTIVSVSGLIISFVAVLFIYVQNQLVQKSLESQTFLSLMDTTENIGIIQITGKISNFNFSDYDTYISETSKSDQEEIIKFAGYFASQSDLPPELVPVVMLHQQTEIVK